MRWRAAMIVAGLAVLASLTLAADGPAATALGKKSSPYPLYPQFYDQARAAISGGGDAKALLKAIDEELKKAVVVTPKTADQKGNDPRTREMKLDQLFSLRGLAELAGKAQYKDVLLFLLDEPTYLSRFLHAVDDADKVDGALGVLTALKGFDEKRFKALREFCIAFAVVWDDFHGYHWVDKKCGPLKEGFMIDLYEYFLKNEGRMTIRPGELPFELAVYVVHTRVSAAERSWVLQNYGRDLDGATLYKSVPWTMVLSPAHGKGGDMEYTLMNIKAVGGVCMEQAYFAEQVLRLHGVPAVYMGGEGRRPGGHAWVGVFLTRPKPHWDFSAGRYQMDRYFTGSSCDPTNCRSVNNWKAPELIEANILMTAAVFSGGGASLAAIEKSYTFCDAALWARTNMPETVAESPAKSRDELVLDLANEALKANPFNDQVWQVAMMMAKDRKMTSEQSIAWARKLAELTLEAFPDYTVACMGTFLDCSDKPEVKLEIYAKMYNALSKARPDLACNVKVMEGDARLAKGELKQALWCYVYPMVNFSKDVHILGLAQKKLEEVGAKSQGEEVAKACKEILAALEKGQSTPERTAAADIIRKKLASVSKTAATPAASDKAADKPADKPVDKTTDTSTDKPKPKS